MSNEVLHILGTARAEGTGIARIVGALAKGLDPQRYGLHAWFLDGQGPLARELTEAGVRTRVVSWSRGAGDPRGGWRFWQSLRGEKFSIIHQHFGGRSVRRLARWTTGARVIVHLHGRVSERSFARPRSISIEDAEEVIAPSRAVADSVLGLRPRVVYTGVCVNGADGGQRAELRAGLVVGTASRLVPIKGIVYLVRALALLAEEFPELRVEIAGSGSERAAIEKEARILGLGDRITFLGWQDNLTPILAKWDVFIHPSLEEALGIAVLEAMAAGLPVVASAVGGLPELVEDGRTGWLVPPANPEALAERLRWMLLSPEKRLAMGASGRERARTKFSAERMVREISQIYDSLVAPGSG